MTTMNAVYSGKLSEPHGRLAVFTDTSAFDSLHKDWKSLEARDSRCGVFQTHTWLSHLWQLESTPHARLCLLAVYNPEGRIDALAPFVIEQRLGKLGARVLRLLGQSLSDYQDILIADDADRQNAVSLLSRWFRENMCRLDMLELLKIPQNSHLWEHHRDLLPDTLGSFCKDVQTYDQSRHISIGICFDNYLMQLSKPTRKNFRRYWQRLNNSGDVVFRRVTSSQNIDNLLVDLFRLHQQRQVERGQRGMFRTPERITVFTRLFKAMLDEGTLQLHVLEVNSKTFNIDLIFHFNHIATAYNGGMDNNPDVLRFSPGFLAMLKSIEAAHMDPRVKSFDLGQGDESYKRHIAKDIQPLQRICVSRSCLKTSLHMAYHGFMAWAHQNPIVQRLYFGVNRPSAYVAVADDCS